MIKGFRPSSDVEQIKYRLKHLKQHQGQRTRDFIYRSKAQYDMPYGPTLATGDHHNSKKLQEEILRPILIEGLHSNYRKQFHNRVPMNADFDTACSAALEAEEVAIGEEMPEGKTLHARVSTK